MAKKSLKRRRMTKKKARQSLRDGDPLTDEHLKTLEMPREAFWAYRDMPKRSKHAFAVALASMF